MTLTADRAEKPGKTTRKPGSAASIGDASEFAKGWFGPVTIALAERDFDRLFRCSSHRLLMNGRGELRALFEHGGSLYAILAADEALAESARAYQVRKADAMRVVPEGDYQGETLPFAKDGMLHTERLEGMVVQHQGVAYVMTGSSVSFTTELQAAPKHDQKAIGTGEAGRPAGQGLTWYQWCSGVGIIGGAKAWETEKDSAGEAWQAYVRGLKPSQYLKEKAANVQAAVQDASQGEAIPQGIPANAAETTVPGPANVQTNVQTQTTIPPIDTSYCLLPVAHIGPSLYNPRENFDEEKLAELAASIKENGLMQPITVRPVAATRWLIDYGTTRRDDNPKTPFWQILDTAQLDTVNKFYKGTPIGPFWSREEAEANLPRFEIIAGERRWRASKLAGLETIPTLIRQVDDAAAKSLAVIENLQRSDLDPFEEGRGFDILLGLGWSQSEIAGKIGCAQSRISKVLGLKRLPDAVQALLRAPGTNLTPSHGQRLLSFAEFPEVCVALAEAANEKRWTVKMLEAPLSWDAMQVLKDKKLVRVFDSWETAFDFRAICVDACPFRAYRSTTSFAGGACLKPTHYNELQREGKKQQAEQEKGAIEKARAGVQQMTPSFTELPVLPMADVLGAPSVVPTPTLSTPADTPDSSTSSVPAVPAVPDLPLLSSLKGVDVLAPPDGRGGGFTPGYSGYTVSRPAGCDETCPCAGAALGRDNQVVHVCTNPKRRQELKEAQEIAEKQQRTERADQRLDRVTALIEETRASGLSVWEPEGALQTVVLYLLRGEFTRYNATGVGVVGIAARYGVALGEDAIDTQRESLTPDGWEQLVRELSIPQLFLMLAEIKAVREAHEIIQGYGGRHDFSAEMLAGGFPRSSGLTLSAKGDA